MLKSKEEIIKELIEIENMFFKYRTEIAQELSILTTKMMELRKLISEL